MNIPVGRSCLFASLLALSLLANAADTKPEPAGKADVAAKSEDQLPEAKVSVTRHQVRIGKATRLPTPRPPAPC